MCFSAVLILCSIRLQNPEFSQFVSSLTSPESIPADDSEATAKIDLSLATQPAAGGSSHSAASGALADGFEARLRDLVKEAVVTCGPVARDVYQTLLFMPVTTPQTRWEEISTDQFVRLLKVIQHEAPHRVDLTKRFLADIASHRIIVVSPVRSKDPRASDDFQVSVTILFLCAARDTDRKARYLGNLKRSRVE